MKTVVTVDGDVLDALCKRHLGSEAHVPAVLAVNPRLADGGAVYPAGMVVTLPEIGAPVRRGDIRLWGTT